MKFGTNSTAMIIGMYHKHIPIDLILFADPGGEQPHTYAYLPIMNDWLARHGLPEIQIVTYQDKDGKDSIPNTDGLGRTTVYKCGSCGHVFSAGALVPDETARG